MFVVTLFCNTTPGKIRALLYRNTTAYKEGIIAVLWRRGRIIVLAERDAKGVFVVGKLLRYARERGCLAIVCGTTPLAETELRREVAGILADAGGRAVELYKYFEKGRYPPSRLLHKYLGKPETT